MQTNAERNIRESTILLENTKNYFTNTFLETLRNGLDTLNEQTKPISEKTYQNMYDSFERYERETSNLKPSLEPINNLVKDIYDVVDEIQNLIPELKTAINKNKLKFGLQGKMKQMLRDTDPTKNGMDEYQRELVFQPYEETPYNKGGKTKRIHRKSKQTRHRKSRKN
jgi:hypothetical protein